MLKNGMLIAVLLAVSLGHSKSEDDLKLGDGVETASDFPTYNVYNYSCASIDAPWDEGFESGTDGNLITADLSCWEQEYEAGTKDWKFVSTNGDNSISPHSGSLMAQFKVEGYSEPATKLITPSMDLTSLDNAQLTFYFANADWTGDVDELRVYYKNSASDSDWTLIDGAEYTDVHTSWEKVELLLPEADGATDYVIAFEATSKYARGLNLDGVSIGDGPSCLNPTDLAVDSVTADSADVSWTIGKDETDWEVLYGEAGFDMDFTGTSVIVTDINMTLEELESETSYDVYVRAVCSEDDKSIWEGPASFTTEPTCPAPMALAVDSLVTDSADVSWTVGSSEDQWEVIYGEPGFDPDSEGTIETVNGSPEISLSGLTANTEYEVYITAQCGGDDGDSAYSAPLSFTTNCEATTVPFTQDFEDVTPPDLPSCGTLENVGNGNDWETHNETSSGFNSNVLRYAFDIGYAADVWYFTQGIELEAGTNYQITYTYGNNSEYNSEKLKVSYGTSPMASAMDTELADHPEIEGAQASTNTAVFTAVSDDTYYFGFNAYSDATQYYLIVDDIEIDLGPNCPEVSNIDFENLTDASVKVTWLPGGNDTEWEVIYGEAGFSSDSEGETVDVDTGTPEITLTDLDSDTEYDVYVHAICGTDGESDLAGPESFTTLITPPENNYLCDAIALTANNGCAEGSYTNSDAFEEGDEPSGSCLNNFEGTNTVWFSFVAPSDGEATVTTDFSDTEFSTEMVVFEAPTDCDDLSTLGDEVGCASSDSDIELSGLSPGDTYYVRVGGFNNEEGDFCIEVQTEGDVPAPCPTPSDITVAVEEMTVEVTWTPGGDETQWTVIYGEAGFSPDGEGETVNVDGTPKTTLTELEPDTDYEVYVIAICEDDNESDAAGPEAFTIGDMSVDDHLFENFTFYPNPVKYQLTLKAETQIENVKVYNLLGQTVMTENPNQLQTQLHTESLQSGVYLMKVTLKGSTKTFRIVKI